jgi:hypothetical protein
VEPVRIKLYGLFTRTRRAYILQSMVELLYAAGLLLIWWLKWPSFREHMTHQEMDHPTYILVILAVLNEVPWILLLAVTIKIVEMWIILRRFAEKQAQQLADSTKHLP